MPSKSKSQQRFFGMVHAIKKGELDPAKVDDPSRDDDPADVAKEIKPSSAKKFAKTKHKDLPNKIKKEQVMSETGSFLTGDNPFYRAIEEKKITIDMDGDEKKEKKDEKKDEPKKETYGNQTNTSGDGYLSSEKEPEDGDKAPLKDSQGNEVKDQNGDGKIDAKDLKIQELEKDLRIARLKKEMEDLDDPLPEVKQQKMKSRPRVKDRGDRYEAVGEDGSCLKEFPYGEKAKKTSREARYEAQRYCEKFVSDGMDKKLKEGYFFETVTNTAQAMKTIGRIPNKNYGDITLEELIEEVFDLYFDEFTGGQEDFDEATLEVFENNGLRIGGKEYKDFDRVVGKAMSKLGIREDAPPFDVGTGDYAAAAKELTVYAKKNGGVDKRDFLAVANQLSSLSKKKAPNVSAKMARNIQDLDTDVREKVISIMRKNGFKVTARGTSLTIEDATKDQETEFHKDLDKLVHKTFGKRQGEDITESPMVTATIQNNQFDHVKKLEKLAKENGVEFSRKGRTVTLKGKRINVRPILTKMAYSNPNSMMKEESVDLTEREDIAMQVARALKKMGVKPNAKEAEVIKKIPGVLDKMRLTPGARRLISRDPDFLGDVFDSLSEDITEETLDEMKAMKHFTDGAREVKKIAGMQIAKDYKATLNMLASHLEKMGKAPNVLQASGIMGDINQTYSVASRSTDVKELLDKAFKKVGLMEETDLEEYSKLRKKETYTVIYRDKNGKVEGEKDFDDRKKAEKYAAMGNSRDKVGGKYTVTVVNETEIEEAKDMPFRKLDAKIIRTLKSMDKDDAKLIIQGLPKQLQKQAMKAVGIKEGELAPLKVDGRTKGYKETAARLMAKKQKMEETLEEGSTKEYVDKQLKMGLRSARAPEVTSVDKKTGYTHYKFENGKEIVNDGVGITVKFDGKEIAYYDKPKLNYKNALAKISEDLNEDKPDPDHAYMKGVKKDKQDDRDDQFDKQAKMSDDDPDAYKPAPGDKDKDGDMKKTKVSKHTKKYHQMYGEEQLVDEDFEINEEEDNSLEGKAKKTGIPLGILKQVYNRGMAAWKSGHRPGASQQQWAHARVNSFITKGSGTWGKADKDLAAKAKKAMKEANEDCWDGYTQQGMKTKDGRQVPNCVREDTSFYADYISKTIYK